MTPPDTRGHALRGRVARLAADSDRLRVGLAALLVAVPALGLYALTLLPDVDFWDTAEFQAVGSVLGIAHPTGYPTYTLLLWLASLAFGPLGNEAVRANLLSALAVAAGCGILAGLAAALTRRLVAGVVTGAALAVTPQAWSVAVRADPHALHLFFVCLLLGLLVGWQQRQRAELAADRWLLGAAVAFGLSMGNHALTLLLVPGIVVFVIAVAPALLVERVRFAAGCVAASALAAAAVYAYLPLRSAMNPPLDYGNPQTLDGLLYVVFAEQFRGSFHALPAVGDALSAVSGETFAALSLIALLIPVGVYEGVVRRGALLLLVATWAGVGWLFALAYSNAGIERYYLTPLAGAALLAGLGAASVWSAAERALAAGPAARRVLAAALGIALLATPAAAVPARYERLDASGQAHGRAYLELALPVFERDAVVISWWSISTTLWYGQFVEGRRQDLFVVDDSTRDDRDLGSVEEVIERFLGQRPVYLLRVPDDLPFYEGRYQLTQVLPQPGIGSPIFRVDGRRPGGG